MTITLPTICLMIAVVTILVLAIKYHALGSQINERVRERFQAWEQKERDQIRQQQMEIATREAQVQLEKWRTASEASIREDAIRRSQAVTLGKVTEHLVPFLPDFCYNPKDARFIGSPIDFLVFDGLNQGVLAQIIFVEVKTASSALNKTQKLIRDAIKTGGVRVLWKELRVEGARSSETAALPLLD